ncbi:hypothetical protein F4818DRAFT_420220 [Hypoxylon cercidicola]|nr:hypothetical protein F4818DRAFT_420220 [Hypoxylon cercidicola]
MCVCVCVCFLLPLDVEFASLCQPIFMLSSDWHVSWVAVSEKSSWDRTLSTSKAPLGSCNAITGAKVVILPHSKEAYRETTPTAILA